MDTLSLDKNPSLLLWKNACSILDPTKLGCVLVVSSPTFLAVHGIFWNVKLLVVGFTNSCGIVVSVRPVDTWGSIVSAQ